MTRYIPATHDPILTELNAQWRRTDQEIADEMGFSRDTVTKHRTELGLPRYIRPKPVQRRDVDPPPHKPKQNPLLLAQQWLGRRLVEKPSGYWLDGIPVNLDTIMRATNAVLKEAGADQCVHNPLWRV